jgi:hypothetical protein
VIELIRLEEPPELPGAPTARSVEFWSIGYGSFNDLTNHTPLLYVGVVPISLLGTLAYLWAHITPEGRKAGPAALREARRVADAFFDQAVWDFAAYCEVDRNKNARFLRWLGFKQVAVADGFNIFWRPKCR